MSEPVWVSGAVIVATHEELLNRFGGRAGTRDEGMLTSALDRPKNLSAYAQSSLFLLAATYAAGIILNHPFVDGNKRPGFMAAYIFLETNGHRFEAPEEEVVERTLALAAGAISEAEYAVWLEKSCGQ